MKNILVICPTTWDMDQLNQLQFRERYHFIFEGHYSRNDPGQFDVEEFLEHIVSTYKNHNIDGVLGTHDYPGSILAAVTAKLLGYPCAEPQKILLCQHKYYSRKAQQRLVPTATPGFFPFHPDRTRKTDLHLPFPFFVKPVKSFFSHMAKKINNFDEFLSFLPKVKPHITQFVRPFNVLLKKYADFELDGSLFIAEQFLEGSQVTVEGYSFQGDVFIMGITDSIMYPGTSSFERFEYPSKLPASVQERMANIARCFIQGIELNNTVFNIEMIYKKNMETIHIIEVNTRMSYQFSDMFEKVDGTNSYDIQLKLATGERPVFRNNCGSFKVAVSFVFRVFEDKTVKRLPTEEEIFKLHTKFPDLRMKVLVSEGEKLSDHLQDNESYRYLVINLGGSSWQDVYSRFEEVRKQLKVEFHVS